MWELYLPPTQRRDTTTRKGKTHREMSQRRDRDETEMRHGEKEERDRGEKFTHFGLELSLSLTCLKQMSTFQSS